MNQQLLKAQHIQSKENKGLINIIRLSDVKPEKITWLWPGSIAIGKLTVIAGDPGLGKSMLSVDLASRVSNGGRWPVDNTPCPKGDTILLSAEDDPGDTIRPRVDAAGADPDRVHFIKSIPEIDMETGEELQRTFSLKRDIEIYQYWIFYLLNGADRECDHR